MSAPAVAFAVAALLCAGFVWVPPLRRLVLRSASGPRWRLDAVPVTGGVAMGVGFAAATLASLDVPVARAVAVAAAVGLVWGLVDDLATLRPMAKLAGQAGAGVVLVALGVSFPLVGGWPVEAAVTVIWVVVVINAVNLLDNIDGAAAGVGLVAAAAVWWWWATGDGGLPVVLPAAAFGAIGGFLVFNLRPARIFMGDAGSTWLGTLLAALAIVDAGRLGGAEAVPALLVMASGVVLVAVPLFDTALVTVERLRHRRPVTEGGTDHTAHRLVAAGMSPGVAVAVLWLFAVASAFAATALRSGAGWFVAAVSALVVGFAVLARVVARVGVY